MFVSPVEFTNLGDDFFAYVKPEPIIKPYLLHINSKFLNSIQISNIDWLNLLNECSLFDCKPIATVYSGHQFGSYNPKLGDGRALLITQYNNLNTKYELQTKGGGLTPFSRQGDGRAVLRSSIREYIASIAMVNLNVPTTNVTAIITSETPVYREKIETASIICRMAPSFIRFGHFEYFTHTKQIDNLKKLLDFTLDNYFDSVKAGGYISMFKEVVRRSAYLVAKWQSLGFCHGVMNTDNMSILGLTLDYGPYAFMDDFKLDYICNHSDYEGRYSYYKQPDIMWWNLQRLADSLLPLVDFKELKEILAYYSIYYNQYYLEFMGNKLGLSQFNDLEFLHQLITILHKTQTDWTYFWASLTYAELDKTPVGRILKNEEYLTWNEVYQVKIKTQENNKLHEQLKLANNPIVVPRNYLLQNVITDCEEGNYQSFNRLAKALETPYIFNSQYLDLYQPPSDDDKHIVLSCSS